MHYFEVVILRSNIYRRPPDLKRCLYRNGINNYVILILNEPVVVCVDVGFRVDQRARNLFMAVIRRIPQWRATYRSK